MISTSDRSVSFAVSPVVSNLKSLTNSIVVNDILGFGFGGHYGVRTRGAGPGKKVADVIRDGQFRILRKGAESCWEWEDERLYPTNGLFGDFFFCSFQEC